MFCIFIWYKELNLFCVFGVTWDICMCVCIWHLYLSVWSVTKHRGRSPSPMGVNWVSDRVSIDSTEYMHHKSVRFSGSLKQATVVDFWKRNGTIPVGTKLLLLSNRLQGFWWDRTILHWDFSVHVVVTTYTSVSVTKAFRIFTDQKIVSTYCERVSLMWLWCKRKRWGFFSTGEYLYLYLHLLYNTLVNISWKWKDEKGCRGGWNLLCVMYVLACS